MTFTAEQLETLEQLTTEKLEELNSRGRRTYNRSYAAQIIGNLLNNGELKV